MAVSTLTVFNATLLTLSCLCVQRIVCDHHRLSLIDLLRQPKPIKDRWLVVDQRQRPGQMARVRTAGKRHQLMSAGAKAKQMALRRKWKSLSGKFLYGKPLVKDFVSGNSCRFKLCSTLM